MGAMPIARERLNSTLSGHRTQRMSCIRVHLLFVCGCTYWHAAGKGKSSGNCPTKARSWKPSGQSPARETEFRGVLVLLAEQRLQNSRLSDRCREQLLDPRRRRECPDTARQNPARRFRTCRPEKKDSRKLRVHAALASSPWQTAKLLCICSAVAKTAGRRFNGDTKTEAPNPHLYLGFITCDRILSTLKAGIKWLS